MSRSASRPTDDAVDRSVEARYRRGMRREVTSRDRIIGSVADIVVGLEDVLPRHLVESLVP
ncbi:hypothetical protein B2J88_33305 [Rhodococcus sp. SRB_17]|nr:hypothetical protein [Rhodococcus sp. SRB_17]